MVFLKDKYFWLAAISTLISSIGMSAITGVVVFLITKYFGLSKIYISVFMVSGMLAALLVAPKIGKYADVDRFHQKKMMIITAFANLIGIGIFYFTDDFWIIMLVNVTLLAVGSSSGFLLTSYAKIYSRKFGELGKDAVMFNRAMTSLAWVIGPAFGGLLLASYGFDILFLLVSLFNGLSIIMLYFLPAISMKDGQQISNKPLDVKAQKVSVEAKYLLASFFTLHTVFAAIIILLPLHIIDIGGGEKQAGFAFSIAAFVEIPILIFAAKFLRVLGDKKMLYLIFILATISFSVTGSMTNINTLYFTQIIAGVMMALTAGIGMSLIQETMPEFPSTIMAYYGNMHRVAILTGSALSGTLAEYFLAGNILISSSVLPLCGLVIMWVYYKKYAR